VKKIDHADYACQRGDGDDELPGSNWVIASAVLVARKLIQRDGDERDAYGSDDDDERPDPAQRASRRVR
jgi:hypothetical protein